MGGRRSIARRRSATPTSGRRRQDEARRTAASDFVNPNYDAMVECLPTCQDATHPALYAPIKAGEHRLQKILTATGSEPVQAPTG